MGINRLLIDSRIYGVWAVWHGRTVILEQAWRDAGTGRMDGTSRETPRPASPGSDASLQWHVQWLMTVVAVSALVERVGWSLQ